MVKLRQQYDMKSEVLGPEANMKQEVRILNSTLRWGKKGIEYEADDRHAIKIMQECAVMNVRASKTPGTPGHADENCANNVRSSLTDQEKSKFRGVAARINDLPTPCTHRKSSATFKVQGFSSFCAHRMLHDFL